MRMHVDRRHERVLALVQERGSLRVTDLAGELGVSVVTVRRDVEALSGQGRLVRRHGAVLWPGATSRGGVQDAGRAGGAPERPAPVVGMVVPTVDRFFGDMVRGAREAVEAQGGRLLLGLTSYQPEEDAAQIGRLLDGGANGLLLAPSWQDGLPPADRQQRLRESVAPVVLVERWAPPGSPAAELDRVRTDRAHGAAMAVRHLADLGHRRIALAVQESVHAGPIRDGFDAAVRSSGRTPVAVPPSDEPAPTGARRLERTLECLAAAVAEDGVTAALVHSDADAITLVARLRERGVRVPEDLAVVAYDDEVASLAEVPLTAVAPPKRAVGAMAAQLLLTRIAENADREREVLPRQHLDLLPELHVRASCGGGVGRTAGPDSLTPPAP
ncbi:substrate-binding domain-containing protein [Streptomyces sp. NPDC017993]|uniref:substrate-binding domain-containing protein n=1 Tax=Streptomyces sp. NPDC017993 TaxID=3365027 RepID=UPI00378ABE8A